MNTYRKYADNSLRSLSTIHDSDNNVIIIFDKMGTPKVLKQCEKCKDYCSVCNKLSGCCLDKQS